MARTGEISGRTVKQVHLLEDGRLPRLTRTEQQHARDLIATLLSIGGKGVRSEELGGGAPVVRHGHHACAPALSLRLGRDGTT